jgi:hypothetical protein
MKYTKQRGNYGVVAALDFVCQVGIKTLSFSTVVVGVYREDWQA